MFTGFVAIFYLSNCQRWDYTGKEQESKYYFWCKMTRKRKKYVKKLSY